MDIEKTAEKLLQVTAQKFSKAVADGEITMLEGDKVAVSAEAMDGLLRAMENDGIIAPPTQAIAGEMVKQDEFDVRTMLKDVVPGDDGMGHEVYFKNVAEVVQVLTDMSEKLEAIPQTPVAGEAIPQGYVLVPAYPTKEMRHAGNKEMHGKFGSSYISIYTAMIAAAPSQGAKQ